MNLGSLLINMPMIKCFIMLFMLNSLTLHAQSVVTNLLGDPLKQADRAYLAQNYDYALEKYSLVAKKEGAPKNIQLRLARSNYFTHNYNKAVESYNLYIKTKEPFSGKDPFYFAESLASIGEYEQALKYYALYLERNPNNTVVSAKIWRINNLKYLYEDSLKNAVHFAEINTKYDELQMVSYLNDVIFIANQPTVELVEKVNVNGDKPFYHMFMASTTNDPFSIGAYFYDDISVIGEKISTHFNIGPVSIFDQGKQMVYAANSLQADAKGFYQMQLFFAKRVGDHWVRNGAFAFNNINISYSNPSITASGQTLYFTADLVEGFGGSDIYVAHKIDGEWQKPENLGNLINTEYDETTPFIHTSGDLYFSSNGHPGIGATDIFKASFKNGKFDKVVNLGYPINSSYDDFGFSIDSLRRQGFMTSNRAKKGKDDDIYELDMNLQSYPLEVGGLVKFIEHNWMDSTQLQILANVKMKLIDINADKVIQETVSSESGEFNLTIPYYSQYKIQITGNGLSGLVSFEVPKYAKENQSYQIVVVNDDFKEKLKE